MKAFRVRDVSQVEEYIGWQRIDGTAYVPVGGTRFSYVTVSAALACGGDREGRLTRCAIESDAQGGLQLVPENGRDDGKAIVVIPAGGFEFGHQPVACPNLSRAGTCALLFVLSPEQSIRAFPRVRTIAEMEAAKELSLKFDGQTVTFELVN